MSEQYRIGDIAKLLDIPMQNLRFYEEKGIISPQKNKENGYRNYTAWNLNDLLDSLRLRGMDFSLEQINKILKTDNLEQICESYRMQENKILEQLEQYKVILDVLSKERIRIQNVQQFLGKIQKCKMPDFIFQRNRKKNVYQDMEENQDLKNLREKLREWLDINPEPIASFYIPFDSLMNHQRLQEIDYWYGFCLESSEALKHRIKPEYPNEYIASCSAVYTVFRAAEEGTFMEAFYHQVYEKIKSEGYIINGAPFGRLVVKAHEENGYFRYFETWIPIIS